MEQPAVRSLYRQPGFSTPASKVRIRPSRDQWVSTLAGLCDAVWNLTDSEQVYVLGIVGGILDKYNIPERSDPLELPQALVMEIHGEYWSLQLTSRSEGSFVRPIRPLSSLDQTYPLEVWRETMLNMVFCAYPDMEPLERVGLSKDFTDLLAAIGVPDRAPAYLPHEVMITARTADAAEPAPR